VDISIGLLPLAGFKLNYEDEKRKEWTIEVQRPTPVLRCGLRKRYNHLVIRVVKLVDKVWVELISVKGTTTLDEIDHLLCIKTHQQLLDLVALLKDEN
jgi:hypothetical protein